MVKDVEIEVCDGGWGWWEIQTMGEEKAPMIEQMVAIVFGWADPVEVE